METSLCIDGKKLQTILYGSWEKRYLLVDGFFPRETFNSVNDTLVQDSQAGWKTQRNKGLGCIQALGPALSKEQGREVSPAQKGIVTKEKEVRREEGLWGALRADVLRSLNVTPWVY